MNSKERMIRTFRGEDTGRVPIAPHSWGEYKHQLFQQTLDQDVPEYPCADILFYEFVHPDWFHLGSGPWKCDPHENRTRDKDRLLAEVRKLESAKAIDEYIEITTYSTDEMKATGTYDHVSCILSRYGEEVFIAINEGNPVCGIFDPNGIIRFEEGLVALVEKPALMARLAFGLYEQRLEWIRILAEYGCHGYVGSETYVGADLISPKVYRDILFPAQEYFYRKVRQLGMEPIIYFCGDINPLIPYINELDVSAMLIEESKKSFYLDVVEIRKRLATHITLFGNLDSVHTLCLGTPEDVRSETRKQLKAASYGRFVMANGSPIAPDTPKENIEMMIETTRGVQERKMK